MADGPAAPESPESVPARHTEITGSQGSQVGDHNIQINVSPGGRQPTGPVVAGEIPAGAGGVPAA